MNEYTELAEFLEAALLHRAGSLAELAEATGKPLDDSELLLEQLREQGFLDVAEGAITYRRPDLTIADVARGILDDVARGLDDTVSKMQATLGLLPRLLLAWEHGATQTHNLHVDVLDGPWAPADMWRLHSAHTAPRSCLVSLPDTGALFEAHSGCQSSLWAARAGRNLQIRVLVSAADAGQPTAQAHIQQAIEAGVQVRMHHELPSFFWVTDRDTIGLPLDWGQAWPARIMATRSPTFATLLASMHTRLWAEAVPLSGQSHPWEPMLRLMSQGMTMETAARALGLTARTGRRRVAQAMAHFGATSQFTLGAAWSTASAGAGLETVRPRTP